MLKFKNSKFSILPFASVFSLHFSNSHHFLHSSSSLGSPLPRIFHCFLVKTGLEFNIPNKTEFLQSLYIYGPIQVPQSLFEFLIETDIEFLNATIKRLSIVGSSSEILDIYFLSRNSGRIVDNYTYPYILKACGDFCGLEEGKLIHGEILKCGYGPNIYVANSLLEMYAKFGLMRSARQVFDDMTDRNLVSWNLLVSAYVLNGYPEIALELCNLMRHEGTRLDRVGMKIILPACSLLKALKLGKSAHAHMITSALISQVDLATSIIDMYAKCGDLHAAERIFNGISHKDVVSWNAMITGYLQIGDSKMVLEFFRRMLLVGTASPSIVTVLVVVQACAKLAVLQTGESIHGFVVRTGLSSDVSVATLLIDMYSKCGELDSACWVFNGISRGTVNSWSAIIHGLGMHRCGEAALMGFFGMLKRSIDPDGICFLLVLSCCSHNGLVNEGRKIFNYMVRQHKIQPRMEHYVTMVDIFGRAGLIDEAFRFIYQMPIKPDNDVWAAFLGACRMHGDFEIGAEVGNCLVTLGPESKMGYYKLLLGIYAENGCWDEVLKIRRLMEERGVKRIPGCSLVEIKRMDSAWEQIP